MPLRSYCFAGDARLEAASASHTGHIVPGARGTHVAKIQWAVITLDGARIAAGELQGQLYGPSTAKAVLDYKRKRQIINRAYQQSADDVVGIMTIQSLDAEMAQREQLPVLRTGHLSRIKPDPDYARR